MQTLYYALAWWHSDSAISGRVTQPVLDSMAKSLCHHGLLHKRDFAYFTTPGDSQLRDHSCITRVGLLSWPIEVPLAVGMLEATGLGAFFLARIVQHSERACVQRFSWWQNPCQRVSWCTVKYTIHFYQASLGCM